MQRARLAWSAAAGLLWTACTPGPAGVEEILTSYTEAVQQEDLDRLFCLSAGAAEAEELGASPAERRSAFERWAGAQLEAYLDGRDAGSVALEDNPIRLVKLFALGDGTFYQVDGTRELGPQALSVTTRLRFGYAHQDLSRFSPGTTVYMCAPPPGRVLSFRVPAVSGETTLEVLDSVDVEWLLARTTDGECANEWAVASARPIAGSESASEITWVY